MRRAKTGNERTLYFDSYALYAIVRGDPNYESYKNGVRVITTIMNLYETYYALIREGLGSEADRFFERFLRYCVPIGPGWVKEAAHVRLKYKRLDLSYVDALGYTIAKAHGVRFLTGDSAFEGMSGIEYVKVV